MALINGEINAARKHFEWVRDNGTKTSVQFPLAITELKKLSAAVAGSAKIDGPIYSARSKP
jgi:hypothetical protein